MRIVKLADCVHCFRCLQGVKSNTFVCSNSALQLFVLASLIYTLYKMGPKRWALIWCLHHIAGVVFAHFDLNDILSVRLMPMSWLMLDNHSKRHVASSFGNDEHQRNGTLNLAQARHDGSSFDIAYSTMGFHRFANI